MRLLNALPRALFFALCLLPLLAHAQSVGTCYNGLMNAVPAPAGGVLDLRPFGYAHCSVTVSNVTIEDPFQDGQLIVTGDGNTIEANGTGGSFEGYQAHRQVEVIGNGNTIDVVNGPGSALAANGNVVVDGTGNTIWAGGFVTEMQHGNTIIASPGGGFYWLWAGGLGGVQGQTMFDLSGPDTVNLVPTLQAYGCSSPTNNPACATSGAAYDSFMPRNVGVPGAHNYCIAGAGCKAANPFEQWVDCSGATNTMVAFLANSNVITGGAAPVKLPSPSTPPVTWPAGIPATLGPDNVSFLGPMFYSAGYNDTAGFRGFGGSFIDIFDPWAYANSGTDTVSITATNGRVFGGGGSSSNSYHTYTWSNKKPAQMHEFMAAAYYSPWPFKGSSDTITVKLTNSGGGSYTASFPITVQQGAVCPL